MSQLRKIKEQQIRESQELEKARQTQELELARQNEQAKAAAAANAKKRRTQTIPLSKDEEVADIKVKNAIKLIKEERYGAARHILRELPDNPKAQQLMSLIEGKTEKRKAPAAISKWGLFMVIFVVIAVTGAIGASLFFNEFLAQFTLGELFTQGAGGDMATYNVVTDYCLYNTDFKRNTCLQWPIQVISDYYATLGACFAPYIDAYSLSNVDIATIRTCLNRYDVPEPY